MGTAITLLILVLIISFIIFKLVRDGKKSKCMNSDCSSCGKSAICKLCDSAELKKSE